jgi:hypothetical protein
VRAIVTVEMVSRYGVCFLNCVFHLRYQVFDGISKWNICNNDGVYDILYRNVLSIEQTWHTVFCAI